MSHLIVRVGLGQPPELLHRFNTPEVARSLFAEEESRLRPDQGVWHLKTNPFHWPGPLTPDMAEAWAREYGACLRAGALQVVGSVFGQQYALMEGLKESA